MKRLQLELFYAIAGEKDWVQGQTQNELLMWKIQEQSMNTWHKIELDYSKEGNSSLKDKLTSRRPVMEDEVFLEIVE